ncbi:MULTISPECIES: NAD-dependent epimerase/dehydratase family protein [Bacteroides]|jgi:UDP-2-acetamido-2,6-beta-L-arabino-hexul-4-ose reductase|uniref:NAD-dependent epimerase/dehydratase family protein n=1 Tax=Bacteroides uniformis TaxID=820 RepID=A0A412JKP4_BACUN|nr:MULTISPECIES: NAD-dependent epimerase/dehydratase family protein [Bacteroides]RGS52916.1 NAD-dependent epimerase/dehydratase family protein [Bacteroides uniformis]RJV41737.1 NAD-dependent epimerase/dehydratase family protein [Bacteroides sp. AF25-38AC]
MKILVTGAKGFIGKNLCSQLHNIADQKARWYKLLKPIEAIYEYDINSTPEKLDEWCKDTDFVFNLANITSLLDTLKEYSNTCPVMISSSSLAALDNSYGQSKKVYEELMFQYSQETGAKVLVYRFPNLFGKWSDLADVDIVSCMCNDIANGHPIQVDDPNLMLNVSYIDDVVDSLISCLVGKEYKEGKYCYVPNVYKVRLGDIVDLLYSFDKGRYDLQIPCVSDGFRKALYSTFVSYLPENKISYPLEMRTDDRGSFSEFIRTENHGQVSININKPGVTKGQHWHHNLVERFLVVSGHGLIQLRKEGFDENGQLYPVLNYEVSGKKLEVVEMIAGYTHNLINLSDTEDMVTVIWANGCFDPNRPDTYCDFVEPKKD